MTRTGNSRTPSNTANFPNCGPAAALTDGSPVIISWNDRNIVSTSAFVFPFTASVIKEAEAFEIAHPDPSKWMSFTVSPSRIR